MAFLRVFRITLVMEWKEMWSMDGIMFSFVSTLGTGIITAWILENAAPGETRDHIYFGTPFLAIWVQGMSRTGLVLRREQWQGTLELMLPSRSPLLLIMASKAVAIATAGLLPAALILAIIYAVTGETPAIDSASRFAAACVIALIAAVSTSLLFSPLIFIYARRPAILNAVWPVGAALGGFLYAPNRLPAALEAVSLALPSSWAIQGVADAARGDVEPGALIGTWLVSLALIAAVLWLTALMFSLADRRIRGSGILAQ